MDSDINLTIEVEYFIPTIPYILDINYILTIENSHLEGAILEFYVINHNKKIVGKNEELLYFSKNKEVAGILKSFITSYGDYELKVHLNNRCISSYSLSTQKGTF